jgi:hypothetical protein
MKDNIINIIKSATAFLQNGVAPPNVSPEYKKALEDENHFASKKFFIVFTAAMLLAFFYFSSIIILFFIPHLPEIVTGFVTMFTKTIEILAVIIAFYTTGQAAVDIKYNSSSNASTEGLLEQKQVDINENILTNNAKEDDYNISEVDV